MRKTNRLTALVLALTMCVSALALGGAAQAVDANNYFVVRAYNADGSVNPDAMNYSYDTLNEVKTYVENASATYFKVTVYGSPGNVNPVSLNKDGVTYEISGASGATLVTPIILNSSTKLIVNGLTMKVANNNAITVRTSGAELLLNSGAAITGNAYGVYHSAGTVDFTGGGAVSDYYSTGGGTLRGSVKYLPAATPTPTPTPTGTWRPTWPTQTPNVPATGIRLSASSLQLEEGDTYRITATVAPNNASNKNVTWSSSNNSVVTVNSSGAVRAVRAGRATITGRTHNGYTATCSVTVTEAETYYQDTAEYLNDTVDYTYGNKSTTGVTSKSSTRIYLKPHRWSSTGTNRITFPADALTSMRDDGYSCIRYDLPSIDVEIYRSMASGLRDDDFWLTVRKTTPTGTMKTQWNKIKSRSIVSPWTISSNSSKSGLVLRIDLPKYYKKSSLHLVRWNGKSFVNVSTSQYSLVKTGSTYTIRGDVTMQPGTYAIVRR